MSKPASGATLDSGNSLYGALTAVGSAVWAMLEGSGSTSADSSGNGHTLTKDSTVTWGTDAAGDAALSFAGASGSHAMTVTTPPDLSGTASWSFAWRGSVTGANTFNVFAGGVGGGASGSNLDMVNTARFEFDAKTSGTAYQFSGVTSFTTDADYLLAYDQPAGRLHLWKDGSEVSGSPLTVTGNDAAVKFASLGAGFDGSDSFSVIGRLSYGYLMAGYAASGTDATNLHSNPYSVFASGGATTTYPQLERGVRGLNRGVAIGGFR